MQGGGISKLSAASSVFSGDVFSILTSAILDVLLWTLCKAHVTYPAKKNGRKTGHEAEALLSHPKYTFPSLLCRDFPLLCKMVGARKTKREAHDGRRST